MKVNALMVRQAFGKVLKRLHSTNEPIIIEKDRKPVAVLISIEMFNLRFVDLREAEKKAAILKLFVDNAADVKENSLDILRESRYG